MGRWRELIDLAAMLLFYGIAVFYPIMGLLTGLKSREPTYLDMALFAVFIVSAFYTLHILHREDMRGDPE